MFGVTICHAQDMSVVLNMRDRVIVEHSLVRLSDVVKQFDGDQNIVQKIENIVVINLSKTNQFKKINRDEIEGHILQKVAGIEIVYKGALNTFVKVRTQPYELNPIINKISRDISHTISPISSDYSVNFMGDRKTISIPVGNISYEYKLPDTVIKKRVPVWVDIFVNSSHYRSFPLWFDVKAFADVVVASRNIKAGQMLTENLITIQKHDVSLYENPVIKDKSLTNLRVKRSIKSGEVITFSLLEKLPPVYRGQNVKVISTHGNITIFVAGSSLDDGKVGQIVRVKRRGANKPFKAIVEKQGLVSAVGG